MTHEARIPAGWLGVNFWSRAGGPRMWARYDAAVVREELATLARHGLDTTRSFCFWPDFVPEPGRIDEAVAGRFADFLDAHHEIGLGTIPTVLVGHMSGENWDPPWRGGRDLYRDVWLVAQQAWLAEELASRYARHPAVVGWLVSNEMPLYGGPAASDEITAWARLVVQALRAGGATQPVSLGDGAWGIETTGGDNGYSLRELAPLVDFLGPHSYPMEDDEARQALAPAFACELAGGFGKPVVLEEFGVTSDFAADDHAAGTYRQVLHTTLLAGATGWLAWSNADYDDLSGEDPYRHHPFEMHFGVTDRHGRPKPQLDELRRFSHLVRGLAEDGWEPVRGDVALVVPEHFEHALPFTTEAYRADIRRDLLQAYVAARSADLPVAIARERDGLASGASLYLLPAAKLLTAPGLDRLRELATAGATVYLSYFAGSTANQRGPWVTWLDELFGVEHRLRYGLVDPIDGDSVTFELVAPLGDLEAGKPADLRRRGRARRAELPPRRAGGRGGRRRRRRGPPGAPPPSPRRGPDDPLHVSDRAHGRADAARQSRGDVAALRRPRRERGGRATGGRLRSARGRGRDPPRRRPHRHPRQLHLRAGRRRAGALHGGGGAARPRPRRAPAARRGRHPSRRRRAVRPSAGHGVSRRE